MIIVKINLWDELTKKGYTTYSLQKMKISSTTLTRIKKENKIDTIKTLNIICDLLKKQPAAVLGFVPDPEKQQTQ